MILIKLADGTKIYSREFEITSQVIKLTSLRYVGGKSIGYVSDPTNISLDAVDVYFVCHRGGKEPEPDRYSYLSDNDEPRPA